MDNWLERTDLLLGKENLDRLKKAHILIVGLGGVGAYAAEQIVRAGVGEITIVDADVVENSNRNRQLPALISTLGQTKVSVIRQRLLDINPQLIIHPIVEFVRDKSTEELLDKARYDYVIDAIDSLAPKVFLVYFALQRGYKVISAMGAGGKIDPSLVKVVDIKKTYQCRLAHALRKRLHHLGVRTGFKAVFSPEIVPESAVKVESDPLINKMSVVGTISYMPAIFGCFAAAEVLKELIEEVTNAHR